MEGSPRKNIQDFSNNGESVPGREDQLCNVRSLQRRYIWRTDHHLELVIGDHAVMVTIRVVEHLQIVHGLVC